MDSLLVLHPSIDAPFKSNAVCATLSADMKENARLIKDLGAEWEEFAKRRVKELEKERTTKDTKERAKKSTTGNGKEITAGTERKTNASKRDGTKK